ncbi:hypothetical protein D3C78_1314570 [compost metagenome]
MGASCAFQLLIPQFPLKLDEYLFINLRLAIKTQFRQDFEQAQTKIVVGKSTLLGHSL